MKKLLRYRRTIGSLLAIFGFILQWTVVDRLESRAKAVFPGSSFGIGQVEERSLEILYFQTKDPRFLADSLQSMARRFGLLHLSSSAFREESKDQRSKPVVETLGARPRSWDEYQKIKRDFDAQMGKFLASEWLNGAKRIEQQAQVGRILVFAVSLFGLILVWSAETFPNNRSRKAGAT